MVGRITRRRSGSSTGEITLNQSNEQPAMSQPIHSTRSHDHSINQSMSHSQPLHSDQSVDQSTNEQSTRRSKRLRASESESKEQEQKESLDESMDQPVDQSADQLVEQAVEGAADADSSNESTNRGTKRQRSTRTGRSNSQSNHQAVKQSKSKSKRHVKEEMPDPAPPADSDDSDDETDTESARKKPTSQSNNQQANQAPLLAPSAFSPEDLHCVICLDFPVGEIYQCNASHFLCSSCWVKVTESEHTECPTCRTYLNREKPIRARFAEQILAGLLVECPLAHLGCTSKVKHSELQVHASSQCSYRTVQCRYHPLGCNWSGLALEQKNHTKHCEVKSWTPKQILKAVNARTEEREKQLRFDRAQTKAYANLCSYLSKRCRDIEFRDVHIETDTLTNERVANTFTACGLHWQLYLDPAREVPASQVRSHPTLRSVLEQDINHPITVNTVNTSSSSSTSSTSTTNQPETLPQCFMHMKLISPIRRKTIVCILILPGPGLGVDFQPAITKVTYTKHALESEPFRVHVPADRVAEVYDRDPINLRVGIIECSRGRMRPHFSTQHSASSRARTQQGDSDSDSESSSDDDDLVGMADEDSDDSSELGPHYAYEFDMDHAHDLDVSGEDYEEDGDWDD